MFVHLHVHTPFSFLDGASPIEELVEAAAEAGMPALAITDHDNVSAAVRFARAARAAGLKPIQGAEVTLATGHHLVLLADGPQGYAQLCRLLTEAHLSHPRGNPRVTWESLSRHSQGLFALSGCRRGEIPSLLLAGRDEEALGAAQRYADLFGRDRFLIELQALHLPRERQLQQRLLALAERLHLRVVATNDVHYVRRSAFPIHDLLTCVRTGTCLVDVHPERPLNSEAYLRTPAEMAQLFAHVPEAVTNTLWLAEQCQPALVPGRELFPAYPTGGEPAIALLRRLVLDGAVSRYGDLTPSLLARLEHELRVIEQLGVADYFLVVWDLVRFARARGIRCAGRGSAADSAVAYCLGITEVDAYRRNLSFERFLSLERAEKPDIDVDFDAQRRDEVAAYVYQRYGAEHVASVCTFHTYHARSALRDLGKAMGFSAEEIDALAKAFPHLPADAIPRAIRQLPEVRQSGLPLARYQTLFQMCGAIAGFPRHMGTHLGGLVISRVPLCEVSPLQRAAKGVTIIQFDKDDVEELGLIKLDLLSLRTLSAVGQTLDTLQAQGRPLDYSRIPLDDPATYAMLREGETVGVFQLESPAQRALQSRLEADHIEDIVASVALIRPGPIKGDMVEPFITRRQGREPVTYVHPRLAPILEKTYGVVLYQEQVIEIATAIAGFTPGEADRLRRVMTHFRSQKEMDAIGQLFIERAVANGISQEVAEVIFSYIAGYAGYGFCEAHAAAFADTAYRTAYLLRHHPAEYLAAILSHQPMGYYSANTLCHEARRRGIPVLGPDINQSQAQFTVEEGAIRVSLRQVRELSEPSLQAILAERSRGGPFASLADLCRRVPTVNREELTQLILAGALDSLQPNRRQLLWTLSSLLTLPRQEGLPLFWDDPGLAHPLSIPDFPPLTRFLYQWRALGLTPERHLFSFFRPALRRRGLLDTATARAAPAGSTVRVAGLVIRPHRPPTKSGRTVLFFALEDETGLLDVTVFTYLYQRCGHLLFTRPAVAVTGRLERRGRGASLIAQRVEALDLGQLAKEGGWA